jgi:hypothetical protein
MPLIQKEFTYNVPNEWYSDDFSNGDTKTFTYHGPEYLTIEVDKETGEELNWVQYTPEELECPTALNAMRITVDCKEDPMLCEIVNDQGRDDDLQFYDERAFKTICKAPEGYVDVDVPTDFHVRDIYDEFNVRFNFKTQEFEIPVRTWSSEEGRDIEEITWNHVRELRNQALAASDGVLSDDMPQELQDRWRHYRQLLRDAPKALEPFGPYFASMMLPEEPDPGAESVIDEDDYI